MGCRHALELLVQGAPCASVPNPERSCYWCLETSKRHQCLHLRVKQPLKAGGQLHACPGTLYSE